MIDMVRTYDDDVGMEFRFDKSAIIKLKKRKLESKKAIKLSNAKEIQSITTNGDLRCLGVLECDTVKHKKMKKIVS